MQYCKLQLFVVDISFAHSVIISALPCKVAPGVTGLRVRNSGQSVCSHLGQDALIMILTTITPNELLVYLVTTLVNRNIIVA